MCQTNLFIFEKDLKSKLYIKDDVYITDDDETDEQYGSVHESE